MDFEYFFFKPLEMRDFIEKFDDQAHNYHTDFLQFEYTQWIIDHCRKAQIFYQSQYRKHSELTWLAFCQAYAIPDYEHPSSFDLDAEWSSWKEEYKLASHYDEYQYIHQYLSNLQNIAEQRFDKSPSFLDIDTIKFRDIDRIWFDQTINNSNQKIDELKSIFKESYEKYRQTTHWKRTRAAVLLVSKAICQAKACNEIGESWYGGNESDVEVHHLNYSNVGNERFHDLALLCRHHHELLHENLRIMGNIGIEIVEF